MQGIHGIHQLVAGLLHLATFLLVAIAITSIVIFIKVFKSDFTQQD